MPVAVIDIQRMSSGSGLRGFWQTLNTSARRALSRQDDPGKPLPEAGVSMRIGGYQIEAEIGRGAVGAVYRARGAEGGPPVAIKTFAWAGEADDPALTDARTRFLAEAEVARRLHHPNIVELFEAGEERGVAYMVMAFAPGRSLAAHAAPDALLDPAAVLETVACVADALAYAHRHGVLHRDIKPSNVIADLGARSVKVTDFGIAGLADVSRTRSGVMLGTPAFMAPEVLIGQRADARSDIYAVGVMLFQLLTGRLPHESASLAQLMRSIVHEPAPDVRQLRPELSAEAAGVVAAALERRPELRCADARQLADDLRRAARVIPQPSDAFRDSSGSPHASDVSNGSEPRHNDSSY